MQEYYKILGLNESATDEEIDAQYEKLKERYSRERFYEGEIGNEAARNLTKLETAYTEIIQERKNRVQDNGKPADLTDVERLLKENKINEAQKALDDITDRSAEWHYLQSVVFYKKNWMNESKKQLEIALNVEPHNEKYSDAYEKLKKKIAFGENQFRSGNAGGERVDQENRQMGESGMNDCMSFCATWCCMNLMCNMCCR